MSSTEPFADRVSADGADAAYQLLRSAGIADAKAHSLVYEESASDYETDNPVPAWIPVSAWLAAGTVALGLIAVVVSRVVWLLGG